MINVSYGMPSQKIRIFQVKKKKVKKGDKGFEKNILNNRLLPDGNEDEYQQDDIESWASKNIGFLNNSPEWGNDTMENDWVQKQKKVHQSVLLDTSKLTKNLQKDSKIVQLQTSQNSPLLKQDQPANSLFTDNQFPPNWQSLTGQWGKMEKYNDVYWNRAAQQLKNYVIFDKKISPKDPIQGKLGNCYFLAGLAALAERPDRIFNLFLVRQVNNRGYLSVKMLVKGRWRVIDLDQYFPFQKHVPVFSHVTRNELWVMILQKAWAKIYSCYMGISSGHVQQVLHDLTGAPIKFFKLKSQDLDNDRLWKYLMKASKKEYAMCASSNKGSDDKMSETGIVLGHAYTILNATILEFQGKKIKLLQLRNPWGRKENLGPWGDKDQNWKKVSAQQKQRLHYENTLKDGIFYMQFEDFLRQYRAVTVAQINDNASYVYQTVKDPNISGVYFRVQIKQNGHYSFQVDKTSQRFFTSKKQIGYKYPSATVKIYSQSEHYKEIHHFSDKQRLTSRRYSLFKGLYIVFVLIQFNKNYETDYDVTLAIYSQGPATIQIASKKDIKNVPNLTRQPKSVPKQQISSAKSKSRPKDKGQEPKVGTIRFHYSNSLNNVVDLGFNEELKRAISQDVKIQIKKKRTSHIPIIRIGGKKHFHHEQPKSPWGNHLEGQEWINQQAKNQNSNVINGIGKCIADIVEHQVTFIEPCPQAKKIEQTKLIQKDYFDERFPANLSSLTGQWGNLEQWKNVRWQRISKIMPNAKIFQGKIAPQSIKQGFLGDCYFLAGVAALAQRPDRIFNLFLQHQRNASNSYSVKILYKGKWLTINMDDYIPYMYDLPAFSRANKDELWVMLLEKAWAKVYSSYKRIEAGFPEQTLHDLTGAPIRHIFMQRSSFDMNKEWTYLMNASAAEYSMVASSQAGSDSLKSVTGIVQGHAYTLLQVAEVTVNNRVERIVQLRNPWGKGENTGRWADNDPIWNLIDEKTKAKLGYAKVQDGIFYMPYESFCKEFKIITIAQINDNASYIYKSIKDPSKNGCFFKVHIIQKGKYSFQVDSTPQRTFEIKYNTSYRYPNIKFELGMLTDQGYIRRITSMEQNSRTSFYISDFQVGFYICFVRIDFDPNFEKDFDVNLAIYGDYASNIEFATKKQAVLFSNNPNIKWDGQETLKKPQVQWNALRSYRKDRRPR